VLEAARAKIGRITPTQAYAELLAPPSAEAPPVVLIDIRPAAQRLQHGGVHGSLIIERNVLEWRLDPRCDARLAIADRYDLRAIIFCQEGYTSSLAAAALQELGLWNATDVVGGFKAWKEAGFPTLLLVDDSDAGSEISSVISTDPASRSEIGSYIERTSAVGGSVIGESNARGSTSNGRRSVMTDSVHYYASPEQDQTGSTLSSRHARSESAPKTMSRYSSSERDAPKAPSRYSPSERSAATGQSARRYTGTDHSGTVTPRQTPSDGRSSTPLQVLIEAPSLRPSTRESMTDRGYETAPGGSVVSSSNAEY
jgi:rhodanese-related sulfurtransferase